ERMRETVTARSRFVESMKSTKALIEKARTTLDAKVVEGLDVQFKQAMNWMGMGGFNAGYDAMTDLEAKVQRQLRMKEGMPQPGLTQSDEVRRTKFELDMKNLTGVLKVLVQA